MQQLQNLNQSSQVRDEDLVKDLQILDYSPNWDFTTGGAKILICLGNQGIQRSSLQQKIRISFGSIPVAVDFIQPTVIKCFAPSNQEGMVNLYIHLDGDTSHTSSYYQFEYR
jgi:hypothetical protein